jgi:hypothetical protein
MIEVELQVPDSTDTEAVRRAIEEICASHALTCTSKGTLLRYPASVHWHFKQVKQTGTLEITWWENQRRLWFKVARNGENKWIDESIPLLKEQIENALLHSH